MQTCSDQAWQQNLRLNQLEYEQRHVYLYSRPRCIGLVLANACNIDCIHCYQAKNGNNLLRPPVIASELRRELMAFYPYLSTLRVQGGEVFAIRGFRELLEDVAHLVRRPILSISTNGTLIDDKWAELLVRTPVSNLTVSIDGGTRETYNRLRRGADLENVLANIRRVSDWKRRLASEMPYLDSFFVVMRSNFREIPQYLALMQEHGMIDVALQTMELSRENTARVPALEADEAIAAPEEVRELHAILTDTVPRFRRSFRMLRFSGLETLFAAHGLDAGFLEEGRNNLYPNSDDLASGGFELCPNPWTTLFLAENGDAHLCFISEPVGNLYAESLSGIWNSPRALAKRSHMLYGRYLASGCSKQYCGWREGKPSPSGDDPAAREEWSELVQIGNAASGAPSEALALVRRVVAEERRKCIDLEARRESLEALLAGGQKHIDHLEAKTEKAVADFRQLASLYEEYRSSWLVRAAHRLVNLFERSPARH